MCTYVNPYVKLCVLIHLRDVVSRERVAVITKRQILPRVAHREKAHVVVGMGTSHKVTPRLFTDTLKKSNKTVKDQECVQTRRQCGL